MNSEAGAIKTKLYVFPLAGNKSATLYPHEFDEPEYSTVSTETLKCT